jgi:signal peptidase I
MSPFIRNGETVEIAPIESGKIRSGDIIFYRTNLKRLVAHRVIKRMIDGGRIFFITKGDRSPVFDEYVYSDDVLGKVVAVEKKGRIIRFDRGVMRLLNIIWARISPFNLWAYPGVRIIRKVTHKIMEFTGWPTL